MDISQLSPVVVLPALLAILFAPQAYAAVRKWKLPTIVKPAAKTEATEVAEALTALTVLEGLIAKRGGDSGKWAKGCKSIRSAFLPPIEPGAKS